MKITTAEELKKMIEIEGNETAAILSQYIASSYDPKNFASKQLIDLIAGSMTELEEVVKESNRIQASGEKGDPFVKRYIFRTITGWGRGKHIREMAMLISKSYPAYSGFMNTLAEVDRIYLDLTAFGRSRRDQDRIKNINRDVDERRQELGI